MIEFVGDVCCVYVWWYVVFVFVKWLVYVFVVDELIVEFVG